ncbi:MAG: hypothetical protein OZSIB_4063 [Candidatus Ozemobacter sibiricus]|jgi:hypothetical protein|uniref:Uncharacterized protein n=1 Tax=Candidatus Ozemobacter sibiricus TaxID=2268124 RepID=A0A367ZQG1_9BACT|nr:MAG: hypothetical protein OZSIB_4063 [Candidatus Ozemobacter sibiricus]
MKINHWLWLLWGAMILSMLLKQKIDTYMVVALIILPILIALLELQEEVSSLKEEGKHQRKYIMDRFAAVSDKLKDLSESLEKKLVVDFAEFARTATPTAASRPLKKKKKKKPAPAASEAHPDLVSAAESTDGTKAAPSSKKA